MTKAPILFFTYNRPLHTKRTIEALQKNEWADESDLFIFSDGEKNNKDKENVQKVREYLQSVRKFRSVNIIAREYNYGLANNIIEGVTSIIGQYKRVIVVEDDLLTSPYFLRFMNEALNKYENADSVISIHGYCLPIDYDESVFFLKGADCWGWATWERGWKLFNPDSIQLMQELKQKNSVNEFDFNGTYDFSGLLKKQVKGKINSWAIRWYASAFIHNKLTLYPGRSLVKNIGGEGSGTHLQDEKQYQVELINDQRVELKDIPIVESKYARELIEKHFFKHMGLKKKLKRIFK